ncbi:hypothetical protein BCV70DRAFT_239246 [Testicularia cyperi]|uniref:Uncharacterized protein n=1 Tax=Testicularia cyperi TaxID=1882483 RepID=A0A317XHQ7_9BASI|nr:hypothetical protein BCV70DRAFT_239246 [Testicularia cyperi]
MRLTSTLTAFLVASVGYAAAERLAAWCYTTGLTKPCLSNSNWPLTSTYSRLQACNSGKRSGLGPDTHGYLVYIKDYQNDPNPFPRDWAQNRLLNILMANRCVADNTVEMQCSNDADLLQDPQCSAW